jgi:hypothetical protein
MSPLLECQIKEIPRSIKGLFKDTTVRQPSGLSLVITVHDIVHDVRLYQINQNIEKQSSNIV